MWPTIGPVRTYGLLYFTGIVLHFVLGWRIARHVGLKRRVWIVVSICYFLGMTFGAKLLYDLRRGPVDLSALFQAGHWLQGGLWGGLLAYLALAIPAVFLLTRRRRAALDLIAMATPVPWIAAKLGCLSNGCCYGRPCSLPWAITFPEAARDAPAGVPVHPTQLYEVGLMLLLLLVFAALRAPRWQGTKLLWFLVLYGFGRAATDIFRGDTERYLIPDLLSLTQFICFSVAVAALGALMLWPHRLGNSVWLEDDGSCGKEGYGV